MKSQLASRDFCIVNKSDILVVLELKATKEQISYKFWHRCGLRFVQENDMGGNMSNLLMCCKIGVDSSYF